MLLLGLKGRGYHGIYHGSFDGIVPCNDFHDRADVINFVACCGDVFIYCGHFGFKILNSGIGFISLA